jgi:hypothetical protein
MVSPVLFYLHHCILKDLNHQYYINQPSTLANNECMISIDFKENIYLNRGTLEESHQYYNRTLRSVLGFLIYYKVNGKVKFHYVDYISECLSHTASIVVHCLTHLIRRYCLPKGLHNIHLWLILASIFIVLN